MIHGLPSPNVAMITLMQHVKIFKNSIYCLTDFTFVAESAAQTHIVTETYRHMVCVILQIQKRMKPQKRIKKIVTKSGRKKKQTKKTNKIKRKKTKNNSKL